MLNYAPVVIFGYNRADMLEQLLKCLEENKNINKMKLYFFLDVPGKKSRSDIPRSEQVVSFVEAYRKRSNFGEVYVEIAPQHRGLADSIIYGVTKIINQFGKAIVLEDDLMVSNDFLDYMQRGLEFYRFNQKVWSVAGYSDPFPALERYNNDVFLLTRAESWGWGTWADRWNQTDWNVESYARFRHNMIQRVLFNFGGKNLCSMLDAEMANKENNSWAIRWSYQQFLERKFTVYPRQSRVIHCGKDNRSTHCMGWENDRQQLKSVYKRCRFVELEPSITLLLGNKRVCGSILQLLKNGYEHE